MTSRRREMFVSTGHEFGLGASLFRQLRQGALVRRSPVSGRLGVGRVHNGCGAAATASAGVKDRQRYGFPPAASVGPWRGLLATRIERSARGRRWTPSPRSAGGTISRRTSSWPRGKADRNKPRGFARLPRRACRRRRSVALPAAPIRPTFLRTSDPFEEQVRVDTIRPRHARNRCARASEPPRRSADAPPRSKTAASSARRPQRRAPPRLIPLPSSSGVNQIAGGHLTENNGIS